MAARKKSDRVFNTSPWRHYRRRYAVGEVKVGLAILALLGAIAAWVAWRGANPDPELFSAEASLLSGSGPAVVEADRAPPRVGASSAPGGASGGSGAAQADRGPVPTELAAPGWSERAVQQFGTDNLYEKIDGRAGYYEARGFRRLYYVYLVRDAGGPSAATGTPGAPGAAPGQTPGAPGATGATIDIEMYDLGTVANALGAYAGERQPDATPQVDGESISHIARNAMFLVRGPYYIRALGSDESEPVVAALKHLRARLTTALQGAPLPWTFPVFVAGLGVDPGAIGYVTENAFSFGFAHRVHTADIDDDGGQAFLVATADADAAAALAKQFADGFSSLGSPAGTHDGVIWSRTPFIETISGATAVRSAVIGVKDAADVDAARAALSRLKQTVQALPDDLLARAAQAQSPPQTAPGAETPAAGGDTDYDSHSSDQRGSGADGAGAAESADPTDEY